MYFEKSRLREIRLDKCLKSPVSEDFRQKTWKVCRNIVAIVMAAPLHCLLKTLKVVALEKVCFRNTQNPKTVC